MRVGREVALAASADRVWEALWDVPRMVACVPGCLEAEEIEPRRRYRARMRQKVGPIALSVPLDIRVSDAEAGRLVLDARGADRVLGAEVQLSVRLAVGATEAGSRLAVEAEGRVLGKLGSRGPPAHPRPGAERVDEFAARLRGVLEG
jgi:carbon monoxide dehydrogenase subunit G